MVSQKVVRSKILRLSVLAVFSLCFSEVGFSNQYKELSLAKKVESSDLVLIAKVASITSKDCIGMSSCASVVVQTTLKGEPARDIEIMFDGPIAESDPLCCKVGSTYLMFLKKVRDKYYQSANGPYGIYITSAE